MHDRTESSLDQAAAAAESNEWIYLLGQPQLQDYLNLVRDKAIGGDAANPRLLADEWRTANEYYYELERDDADSPVSSECRALESSLGGLVADVQSDYRYQQTFDTFPTTIEMVEVGRLIAYQRHVARQFVDRLATRLGPAPDPDALFQFCLPLAADNPPPDVRRVGSKRFIFESDSMDFRPHRATLLGPEQVSSYVSFGSIAGVVGFAVGYGSNFLNAIRADDRLVLHNGYHRACALYALGISHAPCIVQTVTRRDELNVAATSAVAEDPAFYFKAKRPPLIKDFFDPSIRKLLPMRRIKRVIEVKFEVQDYTIAE